eukprot:TRINITY_DN11007_c0_g1_i1.p2 TRINITY_DN11007_c0_g1~~TRINITY_DN11007_c0_g1_i1.p2  ORF type:complete len:129 (-),score=27.24 TRINITY_DN11007_c0_g1_i1:16-375(-)
MSAFRIHRTLGSSISSHIKRSICKPNIILSRTNTSRVSFHISSISTTSSSSSSSPSLTSFTSQISPSSSSSTSSHMILSSAPTSSLSRGTGLPTGRGRLANAGGAYSMLMSFEDDDDGG